MLQLSNILPCAAGGLAICAATISDSKLQKTLPSSNKDSYNLLNLDSYSKWRMSFIAGYMFVSTLLWSIFGTDEINMIGMKLFESQEDFLSGISSFGFLISGFLMGAGAKLAHGGITKFAFHGIPTGSKRAIIGLALIVGVASLITAFRAHHSFYDEEDLEDFAKGFNPKFALLAPVILLVVSFIKTEAKVRDIMMSFGTGSLFSLGVILSGLAQRHRMIQSMTFNKTWDPFLLYVVAGVTIVNVLLGFAKRYREIEKKSLALNVDSKFILGCCFMGAGLGISGLTPGSALVLTPLYLPQVGLFFLPFVALGQFCAQPMGEWMIKEMHIDSKATNDSKKIKLCIYKI